LQLVSGTPHKVGRVRLIYPDTTTDFSIPQ
jgi:hypothetical protein